eukprot:GDKI01029759.1.p1 GENE.GDKI01029759.1~~GDKI01029759.1.p1  ORF type:complete len:244 (+),score=47.14 GDKI01029759.1:105-836(+)
MFMFARSGRSATTGRHPTCTVQTLTHTRTHAHTHTITKNNAEYMGTAAPFFRSEHTNMQGVARSFGSRLFPQMGAVSNPSAAIFRSIPAILSSYRYSSTNVPPFHIALPVHDIEKARAFYKGLLQCEEGRSANTWVDFNLHGHQLVAHFVHKDFRAMEYVNDVDKDMVPVPHAGLVLSVPEFHAIAQRLKEGGVKFVIEPHVRFEGKPGEQWTMFLKDPSGNNLEFKAMTNPANLFAKYFVEE